MTDLNSQTLPIPVLNPRANQTSTIITLLSKLIWSNCYSLAPNLRHIKTGIHHKYCYTKPCTPRLQVYKNISYPAQELPSKRKPRVNPENRTLFFFFFKYAHFKQPKHAELLFRFNIHRVKYAKCTNLRWELNKCLHMVQLCSHHLSRFPSPRSIFLASLFFLSSKGLSLASVTCFLRPFLLRSLLSLWHS